jgi:acyl-lipid omega-3 desaturase
MPQLRSTSPRRRSAPGDAASREKLVADGDDFPAITEVRRALPKHVFKASLPYSLYFAFKDLALVAVFLALARTFLAHSASSELTQLLPFLNGWPLVDLAARSALWFLYALVQGTLFWAMFVVGHDCGHGSFSRHWWANTVVGSVVHSLILVPFVAWKHSHRHHHKNTGNMDRDEIFAPTRERSMTQTGVPSFLSTYFGLGMGWFLYLFFGFAPRLSLGYHFWPLQLPSRGHMNLGRGTSAGGPGAAELLCSHSAFLAVLALLRSWIQHDGWTNVFLLYFAPLFVFASWLVVVTFLHHHDRGSVRWYAHEQWSYVRGQVSTIDRSYGRFIDPVIHHIGTHQIHHLLPKIPHYHLAEATTHFRRAFPDLVRRSDEATVDAFVKNAQNYRDHGVVADDASEIVL